MEIILSIAVMSAIPVWVLAHICFSNSFIARALGRSKVVINGAVFIWTLACFYMLFFILSPGSLGGTGAFLSLWLFVLYQIIKLKNDEVS